MQQCITTTTSRIFQFITAEDIAMVGVHPRLSYYEPRVNIVIQR